jgi:hypothetical protein
LRYKLPENSLPANSRDMVTLSYNPLWEMCIFLGLVDPKSGEEPKKIKDETL